MVKVGEYNSLRVLRAVDFGLYLDDGAEGILLPKRFVPAGAKEGDELNVFVYHDGEDRLIATTQHPRGILGDIVKLRTISVTPQGAFFRLGIDERHFCSQIETTNNHVAQWRIPGKDLFG